MTDWNPPEFCVAESRKQPIRINSDFRQLNSMFGPPARFNTVEDGIIYGNNPTLENLVKHSVMPYGEDGKLTEEYENAPFEYGYLYSQETIKISPESLRALSPYFNKP